MSQDPLSERGALSELSDSAGQAKRSSCYCILYCALLLYNCIATCRALVLVLVLDLALALVLDLSGALQICFDSINVALQFQYVITSELRCQKLTTLIYSTQTLMTFMINFLDNVLDTFLSDVIRLFLDFLSISDVKLLLVSTQLSKQMYKVLIEFGRLPNY